MKNKSRTIGLGGGSEEGYEWRARADITRNGGVSAHFYTETSLTKYRRDVRAGDRDWAKIKFSRQFRRKYDIHHEWERGEICYFLTPEEHKKCG
jgi:hypothetical protein